MGKFVIKGSQLTYNGRELGPSTALFADASERCKGVGVVGDRQNPERIDYLFVAGDHVVGLESKTVDDLVSSWFSGRLQRQLRVLLESCDFGGLMIRGAENWHDIDGEPEVRNDLLKWQMLGGFVIFGPKGSPLSCLADVKACFSGQRNVRTAITRYEKREYQGGKQSQMLQAMFHGYGMGPKTAERLLKLGSVMVVLGATDKEWRECGATRKLIEARKLLR